MGVLGIFGSHGQNTHKKTSKSTKTPMLSDNDLDFSDNDVFFLTVI